MLCSIARGERVSAGTRRTKVASIVTTDLAACERSLSAAIDRQPFSRGRRPAAGRKQERSLEVP